MKLDTKALRAVAEKATPGEWQSEDGPSIVLYPPNPDAYRQSSAVMATCGSRYGLIPHGVLFKNDAAYIAAANPAAVLALLDRLEAAEAVCEEAERPAHCDDGALPLDVTQPMTAKLVEWRLIRDGQGGGDGELG